VRLHLPFYSEKQRSSTSVKVQAGWPRFLLVSMLIGLICVATASAQKADSPANIPDVVAKVNGVEISSGAVKLELNRVLKRFGKPMNPKQKKEVIRGIIDKEVVRELVYQDGKTKSIEVDTASVEKELQALQKPYADEKEFEAALKERGITRDDLKHSIEVDLFARKLLDEKIKGQVTVSDVDVKKYYEDNKKTYNRPESYRVQHIFIAVFPPDEVKKTPREELMKRKDEMIKAAELKIDNVLKEVNAGGDFPALAKKYSHDEGSADKDGDLGFVYKGYFDPAFDEAVAKLKPMEVSGVVKTEFGYHIVKLLEKRSAEMAPFSEMEQTIQKHLYNVQAKEKVQSYLDELKKSAKIETFH
jgi:peptidyl-prolyl cis-trans isomerase C